MKEYAGQAGRTLVTTVIAAFIVLASLAFLAPGTSRAATTWTVYADFPEFLPNVITISAGDTVVWHNNDTSTHTVVSETGAWSQITLSGAGNEGSFTFTSAGSYDYFCSIHPTMTGTIVVVGVIPEFHSLVFVALGLAAAIVAISVLRRADLA